MSKDRDLLVSCLDEFQYHEVPCSDLIRTMQYPLPNDNARCVGTGCDKKNICQRHLSIALDTDNYAWFMDVKKEIDEDEICDFFIEWRV